MQIVPTLYRKYTPTCWGVTRPKAALQRPHNAKCGAPSITVQGPCDSTYLGTEVCQLAPGALAGGHTQLRLVQQVHALCEDMHMHSVWRRRLKTRAE
jgi:hypothetical protein